MDPALIAGAAGNEPVCRECYGHLRAFRQWQKDLADSGKMCRLQSRLDSIKYPMLPVDFFCQQVTGLEEPDTSPVGRP
jgi:hypothetical protein